MFLHQQVFEMARDCMMVIGQHALSFGILAPWRRMAAGKTSIPDFATAEADRCSQAQSLPHLEWYTAQQLIDLNPHSFLRIL